MLTLIVEDDELTSMLFQSFLIGYGKCQIAENGSVGLKKFVEACDRKEPYDLICLDLMMPDINGIELLQMIRKLEESKEIAKEERSKIVMTTAISEKSMINKAYEANCDAYLIKPIKRNELLDTVKELGLIES